MNNKISESILTESVRKDLEKIGYETYAEVVDIKTTKRCDLLLLSNDNSIIIEAKLSFNLKVIEQAYHWVKNKRANNVYVLIPQIKRNQKTRKFARQICEKFGIGVMEYDHYNKTYNITVKPEYINNPQLPTLYNEQKLTIASNSNNEYITPFKITVNNLHKYMANKQYSTIIDLVNNIEHHYKSNNSACNAIKKMIAINVITGYKLSKKNNRIIILHNDTI